MDKKDWQRDLEFTEEELRELEASRANRSSVSAPGRPRRRTVPSGVVIRQRPAKRELQPPPPPDGPRQRTKTLPMALQVQSGGHVLVPERPQPGPTPAPAAEGLEPVDTADFVITETTPIGGEDSEPGENEGLLVAQEATDTSWARGDPTIRTLERDGDFAPAAQEDKAGQRVAPLPPRPGERAAPVLPRPDEESHANRVAVLLSALQVSAKSTAAEDLAAPPPIPPTQSPEAPFKPPPAAERVVTVRHAGTAHLVEEEDGVVTSAPRDEDLEGERTPPPPPAVVVESAAVEEGAAHASSAPAAPPAVPEVWSSESPTLPPLDDSSLEEAPTEEYAQIAQEVSDPEIEVDLDDIDEIEPGRVEEVPPPMDASPEPLGEKVEAGPQTTAPSPVQLAEAKASEGTARDASMQEAVGKAPEDREVVAEEIDHEAEEALVEAEEDPIEAEEDPVAPQDALVEEAEEALVEAEEALVEAEEALVEAEEAEDEEGEAVDGTTSPALDDTIPPLRVVSETAISAAESEAAEPSAVPPPTPREAEPPPRQKRPRRRTRAWFEEIFDDDFLHTLPRASVEVTRREVSFIEQSLQPAAESEILDLGCGVGRHAIELARRGFKVTGYDRSLPLLIRAADDAKRQDVEVTFVQSDFRELGYEDRFDAAYCMSTTFGYFDDEMNRKFVVAVNEALRSSGRFLLDVINRDYAIQGLPARVWWEGEGCVVLEEVDFNYFTSRITSKRSVVFEDGRHLEQEISLRCYSLHELGKILHHAGFRVLEVSGHVAHRGAFFGNQSRSLLLLTEKRSG